MKFVAGRKGHRKLSNTNSRILFVISLTLVGLVQCRNATKVRFFLFSGTSNAEDISILKNIHPEYEMVSVWWWKEKWKRWNEKKFSIVCQKYEKLPKIDWKHETKGKTENIFLRKSWYNMNENVMCKN